MLDRESARPLFQRRPIIDLEVDREDVLRRQLSREDYPRADILQTPMPINVDEPPPEDERVSE